MLFICAEHFENYNLSFRLGVSIVHSLLTFYKIIQGLAGPEGPKGSAGPKGGKVRNLCKYYILGLYNISGNGLYLPGWIIEKQ